MLQLSDRSKTVSIYLNILAYALTDFQVGGFAQVNVWGGVWYKKIKNKVR